jgi:hypothetical protein
MLARQSPTFSIGLKALRGGFWINSTPRKAVAARLPQYIHRKGPRRAL